MDQAISAIQQATGPPGRGAAGTQGAANSRDESPGVVHEPDAVRFSGGTGSQPYRRRFHVNNACKEFLGGLIRPFKTMLAHPLATLGTLAGGFFLAQVAPVTIPLMAVAGIGYGLFQIGKGLIGLGKDIDAGDTRSAEKRFADIGDGLVGFLLSWAFIKPAAAVGAQAKTTFAALKTATNPARIQDAVAAGLSHTVRIHQGSRLAALREALTLFTEKSGRQALWAQLNPKALVTNSWGQLAHWWRMMVRPPTVNLAEAMPKAQAHVGIADADMPRVELTRLRPGTGGSYSDSNHLIKLPKDGWELWKSNAVGRLRRLYGVLTFDTDPATAAARGEKVWRLLDWLPRPIKNFLGNRTLSKHPFDETLVHELTHARQRNTVIQLSEAQARDVLHRRLRVRMDRTDQYLAPFKFQGKPLTPRQLAEAEQAFIDSLRCSAANDGLSARNTAEAMRAYAETPHEIEARAEAGLFRLRHAVAKLLTVRDNPGSREAWQSITAIRDALVEGRINAIFSQYPMPRLETLPKAVQDSVKQQLEIWKRIASHSSTRNLLKLEDKMRAREIGQAELAAIRGGKSKP